jgi:hypothetical protein
MIVALIYLFFSVEKRKIWDNIMWDGIVVLFEVGLAILRMCQEELFNQNDIAELTPLVRKRTLEIRDPNVLLKHVLSFLFYHPHFSLSLPCFSHLLLLASLTSLHSCALSYFCFLSFFFPQWYKLDKHRVQVARQQMNHNKRKLSISSEGFVSNRVVPG